MSSASLGQLWDPYENPDTEIDPGGPDDDDPDETIPTTTIDSQCALGRDR
jgi:hypothetical protein